MELPSFQIHRIYRSSQAIWLEMFIYQIKRRRYNPGKLMSRKPKKTKWTEQMNSDVLECKRKAKEMITSQNPPCNENGRKKGYIEVMKDLWNERGYGHLEFKSQNLRDQASRLEKMQERAVDSNTADIRAIDINERDPGRYHVAVNIISNEENNEDENQNNNDQQSQMLIPRL